MTSPDERNRSDGVHQRPASEDEIMGAEELSPPMPPGEAAVRDPVAATPNAAPAPAAPSSKRSWRFWKHWGRKE